MKKIVFGLALAVLIVLALPLPPGFAVGNASVSPPGEELVPIAFGVMSVAVPTDQVQAAIGQLTSENDQYSLYLAGFLSLLHPCASIADTTIVPILAINQVAIRWSMTSPEDLDPGDAQRQRDIVVGGQIRKEPEILEDDADPPPIGRHPPARQRHDILPEQPDEPAARAEREIEKAQERGLARTRWSGEEGEGAGGEIEGDVRKSLRARAVAQTNIFELHDAGHRASAVLSRSFGAPCHRHGTARSHP